MLYTICWLLSVCNGAFKLLAAGRVIVGAYIFYVGVDTGNSGIVYNGYAITDWDSGAYYFKLEIPLPLVVLCGPQGALSF